MVQLIVGNKGKGKTKHLLDKVNTEVKSATGNITYLDKSTKHMFELNNKIRLINVTDYMINKLEKIGEKFGVDLIISISLDENEIPEDMKSKIIVSL